MLTWSAAILGLRCAVAVGKLLRWRLITRCQRREEDGWDGDDAGILFGNRRTEEMGSHNLLEEEIGIEDCGREYVVSKLQLLYRRGRIRIIALRRVGAGRRGSTVGSGRVMAVLLVGRVARHDEHLSYVLVFVSRMGVGRFEYVSPPSDPLQTVWCEVGGSGGGARGRSGDRNDLGTGVSFKGRGVEYICMPRTVFEGFGVNSTGYITGRPRVPPMY